MQHSDVLRRVRAKLLRSVASVEPTGAPEPAPDNSLAGPSLLDQEPDLAKESARHNIAASGWAAGGQPTD